MELYKNISKWGYGFYIASLVLPVATGQDSITGGPSTLLGFMCVLLGLLMLVGSDDILMNLWINSPNLIMFVSGFIVFKSVSWWPLILIPISILSSLSWIYTNSDHGLLGIAYWVWVLSHFMISAAMVSGVLYRRELRRSHVEQEIESKAPSEPERI